MYNVVPMPFIVDMIKESACIVCNRYLQLSKSFILVFEGNKQINSVHRDSHQCANEWRFVTNLSSSRRGKKTQIFVAGTDTR